MVWSASPVAVMAISSFITRYRSRTVHEHELAHEDVPTVRKTTVLVPTGPEANWRLVELHPARTGICYGFVEQQRGCNHGDEKELQRHDHCLLVGDKRKIVRQRQNNINMLAK